MNLRLKHLFVTTSQQLGRGKPHNTEGGADRGYVGVPGVMKLLDNLGPLPVKFLFREQN